MSSLPQVGTRITFDPLAALPLESVWYAVQTYARHEKKVAGELRRKGIESFLPLFPEKHQWSDRERIIDVPLFPQYVFVRIAAEVSVRVEVLRTSGVTSFVGARGLGTAIPENQIAAVQSVLEHRVAASPCSFLDVGKRVRIRSGSLDGVEGILLGLKGDETLVISVELIHKSLTISVNGFRVEPV
ncbi:MAG TPA: UpxY family transcription antiterminator [Candidatus Acidoferrum sp.]|nr:UpxY family transcription antiterminator [Candidatus Acidoferrum sp.]